MIKDIFGHSIFLIFGGAALLSTLSLYTRQSLLVAYIILGGILGPWGFGLVNDASLVEQIGNAGIVFLLFLLGLNLQPQNLLHMLRRVTLVGVATSLIFGLTGFLVSHLFNYGIEGSIIVGVAMMFSSTIIGIKLLPTTILHHQHTGEVMISVLLMQDLIAIIALLILHGMSHGGMTPGKIGMIALALPALLVFAFVVERYLLVKLIARFDQIQEYIFLLSIAWCLSLAELAELCGLSREIGAFIAGISLAASPISLFIAESLKPLRDFFLVLFFFSVGAAFNLQYLHVVLVPAIILATLVLFIKPLAFRYFLTMSGEPENVSREVGVRLGQASEFSLLVANLAASLSLVHDLVAYLIQATTILTFFVSSYLVVLRYPTPMGLTEKMRRD